MPDWIRPERLEEGPEIARGGFGVVLRGWLKDDGGEGRWQVALKSPLPGASKKQEKQFMKEVQDTIAISKKCPRVIQCYGFSTLRNGNTCIVMHLYSGGSLHRLLDEHMDEPLPALDRACIALDIVEAVRELHAEGMLVEDIKPDNVLLDANRRAYLSDFGAFKTMSPHDIEIMSSECVTTLFFAPPEKLRRDARNQFCITRSADIWSLGICLLQLACCNVLLPYGSGVDMRNVAKQLIDDSDPPHVPSIPDLPGMQQLIQRCLQLEPSTRIKIDDLARGLQRVVNRISPGRGARASVPGVASKDTAEGGTAEVRRHKDADGEVYFRLDPSMYWEVGSKEEPEEAQPNTHKQGTVLKISSRDISDLKAAFDDAARDAASQTDQDQSDQQLAKTFDLCGLEFAGGLGGQDLCPPPYSTICNGSIQLPDDAKICFVGCQDVWLEHLSIRGANGRDFAVDIRGSFVGMDDCHVEGGGGGTHDAAVGVQAWEGSDNLSKLSAEDSTMRNPRGRGLLVCHTSSSANLNACDMSGCAQNVAVLEGGKVALANQCCLNDAIFGVGLAVFNADSTVTASNSAVNGNHGHNIQVAGGARVNAHSLLCNDCKDGSGLGVFGSGSSASLSRSSISDNHRTNVAAMRGAGVHLDDCRVNGSRAGNGLQADGQSEDGQQSSARATACSIARNLGNNVQASGGGDVALLDCQCDISKGHGSGGLAVFDHDSAARAVGCSLCNNKTHNVQASGSCKVNLEKCQVNASNGFGLAAFDKKTFVMCEATSISRNNDSNVYSSDFARVALMGGCRVSDSRNGYGFYAAHGGIIMGARTCYSADGNCKGKSRTSRRGFIDDSLACIIS